MTTQLDAVRAPVADAVVDALRDWGVQYVFGVSGANIEHLHDAVVRRGRGRVRSVLARREDGAAFMADCLARTHHTLGVCCCTSGGGMMNLAVGLAESLADGVPVLALIAQSPRTGDGLGAFQESTGRPGTVDAVGLFQAITKRVCRLDEPAEFWPQLRLAVSTALSGRPGPAALLVPRDVFDADVGPRPLDWPTDLAELTRRPLAPTGALNQVLTALDRARRPLVVVGAQVLGHPRASAVHDFARRFGLPVTTTMGARGAFPETGHNYAGVLGAAGHPSAHALAAEADLLLALGTDLEQLVRDPVSGIPAERVIAVTLNPAIPRRAFPGAVVLEADACDAAADLLGRVDRDDDRPLWTSGRKLTQLAAEPDVSHPAPPAPADPLRTATALAAISAVLSPGDRVLVDAGNCGAAALHRLVLPPDVPLIVALGMGGMGYTLPGAIGAALGATAGRTVALCGDGSFLMNGMEIHTAVRLRLPILYVVFNNGMHGTCVTRQHLLFESRVDCTRLGSLNVAGVVTGLGTPDRLWIGQASSPAEMGERLAEYGRQLAPTGVLELLVPYEEVPPIAPFVRSDAPVVAAPRRRNRSEIRVVRDQE